MILGTAAYMAPEQARGKPVDKRADIWAFGCVLFERLTGRRAFHAEDASLTLAEVMKSEPDWHTLPRLSPALETFLRQCVSKDPKQRVRDMGDVRLALGGAFDAIALVGNGSNRMVRLHAWQRPLPAAVASLALLVAGGFVARTMSPTTAPPLSAVTRLTIESPTDADVASTGGFDLTISPDGRRVAFLGVGKNGRLLYVRDIDKSVARALPGTEGAEDPFFSADGRSIGFESPTRAQLMRVSIDGGPPSVIPGADYRTRGATWTPDNFIIYAAAGGLWRISSAGGVPERLTADADSARGYTSPRILPGGHALLVGRGREDSEIVAKNLDTGQETVLVSGRISAYVASGHIVFARGATVFAARFDTVGLKVSGDPVAVLEGVRPTRTAATDFEVSGNGTLVYMAGTVEEAGDRPLVWVERDGRTTPATNRRLGSVPRISPEGRRLALRSAGDVWVIDLVRLTETRLTRGMGEVTTAGLAWNPDGRSLTFNHLTPDGRTAVSRVDVTADAPAKQLLLNRFSLVPGSWSSSGAHLALQLGSATGGDIAVLQKDSAEPVGFVTTPFSETFPRFAPDGRWIGYGSDEAGQLQVYVRPYPSGTATTVSTDGGQAPVWSRDGRTLFYTAPSARGAERLMAVDVDSTGPTLRVGVPRTIVEGAYRLSNGAGAPLYDVAPDGTRFIMLQADPADSSARDGIQVVLNWDQELRARVP